MPSKSYLQHKLFEAVYHDPKIAKDRKISKDVAKEFLDADKKEGIWQVKPTKDNPMGRVDDRHKRSSA